MAHALLFSNSCDKVVQYVQEKLESSNFSVQKLSGSQQGLLVWALPQDLEEEATELKLKKPTLLEAPGQEEFDHKTRDSFKGVNQPEFFHPFEKAFLTERLLMQVETDEKFWDVLSSCGMDASLERQNQENSCLIIACMRAGGLQEISPLHEPEKLRSIWRETAKRLFIPLEPYRNYFGEGVAFYCAFKNAFTRWLLAPAVVLLLPLLVRVLHYLVGDISHFQAPPLLLALFHTLHIPPHDHPHVAFFTAFMVLWSAIGLKLWRRQVNLLALRWDMHDGNKREVVRPQFTGQMRISPVTGQPEVYFPWHHRLPRYLFSTIIMTALCGMAGALILGIMNLQGTFAEGDGWLYFPAFASWARPGALFDPHGWLAPVPMALRVVVVMLLGDHVMKPTVQWLTDLENHRTEESYSNALVAKRYMWSALDPYLSLGALTFIKQDLIKVRQDLLTRYTMNCALQIAMDTVHPLLQVAYKHYAMAHGPIQIPIEAKDLASPQKLTNKLAAFLMRAPGHLRPLGNLVVQRVQRTFQAAMTSSPTTSGETLGKAKSMMKETPAGWEVLEVIQKPEFDLFDHYLEMVNEFGYLTMFAGAFPLAAALAFMYKLVEMKSDTFKLCHLTKRPRVNRQLGIGTWETVMIIQSWLAVPSNVFIFGLASSQMRHWLPHLFDHKVDQVTGELTSTMKPGHQGHGLAVLFLLEHMFLVVKLLVQVIIPNEPELVKVAKLRKGYACEAAYLHSRRSHRRAEMRRRHAVAEPFSPGREAGHMDLISHDGELPDDFK